MCFGRCNRSAKGSKQMLENNEACWSAMRTFGTCRACTVHKILFATGKTTANVVDVAALAPLHETSHAHIVTARRTPCAPKQSKRNGICHEIKVLIVSQTTAVGTATAHRGQRNSTHNGCVCKGIYICRRNTSPTAHRSQNPSTSCIKVQDRTCVVGASQSHIGVC